MNLPNEILIEIFQHLNYWDLNFRVSAVNKSFRALIKSHFSRKLFKDTPVLATENTKFVLHPAFEHLNYPPLYGNQLGGAYFSYNIHSLLFQRRQLIDTCVAHENAVSPAVKKVIFVFNRFWPGDSRCKPITTEITRGDDDKDEQKAVSVLDVVDRVVLTARRNNNGWVNYYLAVPMTMQVKHGQLYIYGTLGFAFPPSSESF